MKIGVIALNTLREAIRDRVLYTLLFFALLLIGSSSLLSTLSIGEEIKIVKNLGLQSISLFGLLIAIFVGIGLLHKEIDRRTVYPILSKPISRVGFLLGKYLGVLGIIGVEVSIMAFLYMGILFVYEKAIYSQILYAIFLIFLELSVVTSIALFFSSFSTPILSGFFTLTLYAVGHLSGELKMLGERSESTSIKYFTNALYYLLPNLENFNIKAEAIYQIPVSGKYILFSTYYALLYIMLLMGMACLIFQKRDFK